MIINKHVFASAIREMVDREKSNTIDWSRYSFPKQWKFIKSKAKKKALQCSRRAGKTSGVMLDIMITAMEKPGTSLLYLAKTRSSAKRIVEKDILMPMQRRLGINIIPNKSELSYKFPNGSILYLGGADQNETEIYKLLGQAYSYAALDEAAFFKHDLKTMIEAVLEPAMADHEGVITLLSTTSDFHGTYYYDVVNSKVPGWEVHKWGWEDNPFMKDKVQAVVDAKILANPDIIHEPLFEQHYMNKWSIDESLLVYRFNPKVNRLDNLPKHDYSDQVWRYILGVDLGWNDATSFVLGAYRKHDKNLYIVSSYKESGLDFTATAEFIKKYIADYNCEVIIDGANKQGVQEMSIRHGIHIEPAEKTAKVDYIRLMNADFISTNIKICDAAQSLLDEYAKLLWDKDKKFKGVLEEDDRCQNHCADAALYLWRKACNFMLSNEEPAPLVEDWSYKLNKKLGF